MPRSEWRALSGMVKRLNRLMSWLGLDGSPRLKKIIVGVIGATVLLFGVTLIVLPGPAFIVIPIGLAILASEFAWARRVIRRGKVFVTRRLRRASRSTTEQRVVS